MLIFRLLGLSLALLVSMAFVVEGPRGGGVDSRDHLERAPRWGLSTGSVLNTGERGLGGGLEYSVDASVCEMRFIDGADCAAIRATIDAALIEWASGHPALVFTNVSDRIAPAFPLSATSETGQGAEIDFFGVTGAYFPPFLNPNTTGYTIFYESDPRAMVLTNGQISQTVGAIQSADVRFNAGRCFYLDTAQGRPECLHFPSVVLHEIGHALGIGHPDENTRFNLDIDDDPSNEMRINCRRPAQGLRTSAAYEGAAVLVGRDVQGPGRWRRGLTWDDVAARDALYPHCGIVRQTRFTRQWGAYVVAQNALEGRTQFAARRVDAVQGAVSQCDAAGGRNCQFVAAFNGCFAYARSSNGHQAYATAPRSDQARVKAVLACQQSGGECRVATDFCAFE